MIFAASPAGAFLSRRTARSKPLALQVGLDAVLSDNEMMIMHCQRNVLLQITCSSHGQHRFQCPADGSLPLHPWDHWHGAEQVLSHSSHHLKQNDLVQVVFTYVHLLWNVTSLKGILQVHVTIIMILLASYHYRDKPAARTVTSNFSHRQRPRSFRVKETQSLQEAALHHGWLPLPHPSKGNTLNACIQVPPMICEYHIPQEQAVPAPQRGT